MHDSESTFAIDQLLTHAGWVRNLAAGLIRDPGMADDVVQETWLAAMKAPPKNDRPARAWLAGTTRNLARHRWRTERRRHAREVAVGQTRADELATDTVAARLETQRDLAQAMLKLGEPWRSTVVWRFVDGLSSAEIARREDIPAATVRGRLKRGLELLRDELDARYGNDRSAWQAALIPFLTPQKVAAAGVATSVFSGVLAMGFVKQLIVGGVLLCTLFGGLVAMGILRVGDDDGDEPSRAHRELAANEGVVSVSKGLDAGDSEGPLLSGTGASTAIHQDAALDVQADPNAPGERPKQSTAHVLARVVNEDGQGISGAIVFRERQGPFGGVEDPVARADAGGALSFEEAFYDPSQICYVNVFAAGYSVKEVRFGVRANAEINIGTIVLKPGSTVRGQVVDENGRALKGVTVVLQRPSSVPESMGRGVTDFEPTVPSLPSSVQTSANGRFEFRAVGEGTVCVRATTKGMRAVLSRVVTVRADRAVAGIELPMVPLGPQEAIRGYVHFEDGRPAKHQQVQYQIRSAHRQTTSSLLTDDTGRFELRIPDTSLATLIIAGSGWSTPLLRDLKGSPKELDIVLRKARSLRVNLTTRNGKRPATVNVYCKSKDETGIYTYFADAYPESGQVDVDLPEETFVLNVNAPGYRDVTAGPFTARGAPEAVDIELEQLTVVSGSVLAKGDPVKGATVRLYRPTETGVTTVHNGFRALVEPDPVSSFTTGEDGRFEVGVEASGIHTLRVDKEGYAPTERAELDLDDEQGMSNVSLELGAGGAIQGRVLSSDGKGLSGLIVGLSRGDAHAITLRSNSKGAFRFDHLVPGRYEIRVVEEEIFKGSASTQQTTGSTPPPILWNCTVLKGKTTDFDIETRLDSKTGIHVTGHLTLNGDPALGWAVSLISLEGDQQGPTMDSPHAVHEQVDARGNYEFDTMRQGPHAIVLHSVSKSMQGQIVHVPMNLGGSDLLPQLHLQTGSLRAQIATRHLKEQVQLIAVANDVHGARVIVMARPSKEGIWNIESIVAGRYVLFAPSAMEVAMLTPSKISDPRSWTFPRLAEFDVVPGKENDIVVK